MRMVTQPKIQAWHPYVFFKDEFTKEECETIIHLSKCILPEKAKTGHSSNPQENPDIRVSELRWMHDLNQHAWVFERLDALCAKVKKEWYPFQLSGFMEPIQITHYFGSEGAHYDWHQDFGPEQMSTRKLSFVMLLNDPSEFKGGDLELMSIVGPEKSVKDVAQGTVIAFPSWEFHRVLRITEGHRWSMVSWVHGEPFR